MRQTFPQKCTYKTHAHMLPPVHRVHTHTYIYIYMHVYIYYRLNVKHSVYKGKKRFENTKIIRHSSVYSLFELVRERRVEDRKNKMDWVKRWFFVPSRFPIIEFIRTIFLLLLLLMRVHRQKMVEGVENILESWETKPWEKKNTQEKKNSQRKKKTTEKSKDKKRKKNNKSGLTLKLL